MSKDHWARKAVTAWKQKARAEREQMVKLVKAEVEGTITCPHCSHIFVPVILDATHTQCPLCKRSVPIDLEGE